MSDRTQALLESILDLWNNGNANAAIALYAPGAKRIDPNSTTEGPEAIAGYVAQVRQAHPDFRLEIPEVFERNDLFASYWTCTGTQTGEFLGLPASGRRIQIAGMTLARLEGGKIVDEQVFFDRVTMLEQLGMLPEALQGQVREVAG
jgi:steroid delta-isomerase-like uncharacterized protein